MTKAFFRYSKHGFTQFEICGHAEYDEEGFDIVCAGISATVITSLNLLIKLLGNKCRFNENQEEGYINFEIIKFDIEKTTYDFVELIISNLINSLQDIEENYPANLIVKIEK